MDATTLDTLRTLRKHHADMAEFYARDDKKAAQATESAQ